MAVDQTRKYKFLSPSVQTREIDRTRRPKEPNEIGAVIIGRSERGPSFTAIELNDEGELIETFGKPIPGGGTIGNDVWREGNYTAPTYGAYAAYAHLKSRGPVTFIRLAGDQHAQATSDGAAGFPQDNLFTPATTVASNAGAYAMFIINSGSAADYALNTTMTGALAAIFYMRSGASIRLEGDTSYNVATTYDQLSGAGQPIRSVDVNRTFRAVIVEGTTATTASFNFQPDSDKFIRKVFNTNPILTNSGTIATTSQNYRKYWLGESYEDFVDRQVTSGSVSGSVFGIIVPLASGSGNAHGGDYRFAGKRGKTGWVFSQDLSNNYATYHPINMTKLFRFNTLTQSEWEQKNLKISISNIKSSKNLSNQYGTFDVEIRTIDDNDKSKRVVERFINCDLNPNSANYIAKKIGDMYREWNYASRQWIEYGNYPNQSKFVYVTMPVEVDESLTDPRLLPFGFYGTPRFKGVTMSRNAIMQTEDLKNGIVRPGNVFVRGTGSMPHAPSGSHFGGEGITWGDGSEPSPVLNLNATSASFLFPTHPLVVSASSANTTSPLDGYFGINVFRNGSSRILAENHKDIVRPLPENYDEDDTASVEVSYYFSLDDVRQSSASGAPSVAVSTYYANAYYESGSRVIGQSITAKNANAPLATLATASYDSVLNAGFNKFTMPLYGGFEGLDVTEKEPFRNSFLSNGTETTNYAFHSIQRAIDSIADREVLEYNLASIPGISDETLTRQLIDLCEERADSLAVIDLNGDYTPAPESTATEANRRGDVDTTIANLKNRGINSSYGCAFYPWVKIRDIFSNTTLDIPPSVVALGTFAKTDLDGEPWDAAAGYNRGNLSRGASGLSVINVKDNLNKDDRDKLYVENINPIAKFKNDGIVIMGQKTLQVVPSALDRINVRRMLIEVKNFVTNAAKDLLFDQNVETTWSRFISVVEPYLRSVKARFGLSDYKLVLDSTTTTPELVDRNIMYAQIYLKPARAIEFIAIDFILEPTAGASFAD